MGEQSKRPRYFLLDELRGLALVLMVVYHFFYLLGYVFGIDAGLRLFAGMSPIQPFIAGTFIFICGVCCRFSRSNAKRGLRLAGAAALVTLSTLLMHLLGMEDVLITFGVLHCLAAAVLLFALLQRPLEKVPALPQIIVFLLLFIITASPLYGGQPGLGIGRWLLPFPHTKLYPLYILGFPGSGLSSADYIPLLPWLPLFFAGTAAGIYGRQQRFPAFFARSHSRALQWLGRHSLLLYLLHQPVMYALIWIVLRVVG